MSIEYRKTFDLKPEQILALYANAGWVAYTEEPDSLFAGIKASLRVLAAFDGDLLVGLIRVVGDGETIIYIQDLLVLEEYQGRGIGSNLLHFIFDEYKHVRQIILLTMMEGKTMQFYKRNGMVNVAEQGGAAFIKE